MKSDYLWDKSGTVDPGVEQLENVLRSEAYAPREWKPKPRRTSRLRLVFLAAAAIELAAVGSIWFAKSKPTPSVVVTRIEGVPGIEEKPMGERSHLAVGQWLATDRSSQASIALGAIGEVTVMPESRVKLVATGEKAQRLELAHGTIRAKVSAPPRLFVVSTPSAEAVDLGCAYTLHVDEAGVGELTVTSGSVSLEGVNESYVPAGAIARLRGAAGPGVPFYADAPPTLKEAVLEFDARAPSGLVTILATARRADALTVWHLLVRTKGDDRRAVLTKLSSLVLPPPGFAEADVDDRAKMEAWRSLTAEW
jgi:hypothetical protein